MPVLGALIVVGLAVWWWAGTRSPAVELTKPHSERTSISAVLASVPDEFRLTPDAVAGSIKMLSDRLPRDPGAIVAAVVAARKSGKLPDRDLEDDLHGAPRSAAALAGALDGEVSPPASTFEVATLAGAVLTGGRTAAMAAEEAEAAAKAVAAAVVDTRA